MIKKPLHLSKVYQLLEPGPVVMVTTVRDGVPNVMTMSWHMMVDFVPPIIAIVMGSEDYSFESLKQTKECVINVPDVEMLQQVVDVGNSTGAHIDKFKKFSLTALPAQKVVPPLVGECFAHIECKVIDTTFQNKYNIFILEGVQAWVSPRHKRLRMIHHCGYGVFAVDGKLVKTNSKKK
ncbi:MAG: flavin reductase family protein [Candidatus Babeliales bacterium]